MTLAVDFSLRNNSVKLLLTFAITFVPSKVKVTLQLAVYYHLVHLGAKLLEIQQPEIFLFPLNPCSQ